MKPTPLTLRKKLALELWRRKRALQVAQHPLRQVMWECTLRCDLRCRHCGSDCKNQPSSKDMPFDVFARALDSIASRVDPHQVFIVITGGEPLLRQDLEQCGAQIYQRGFPWGMVTNGLHLTPARFERLLQAGLHSMTISLDGLRDDHNWMRGNNHSFDMVSQAIDMLVATPGFTFDLVTCVNKRNYAHLDDIAQFLIDKGVKHWRVFSIFPMGRAATDPLMQLSNDEFRGMFDFIRRTRKEGRINVSYGCEGFLGNYEHEVRDYFFSCKAGVTLGSVMADGSIGGCTSIRANNNQGNIYHDDFMDVWENRFHPHRNPEWKRTGDCANCSYWDYCQGNGMHLRDAQGRLLFCHLHRLQGK